MSTLKTSRSIHAAADQVFEAFSDAERLARWWGPDGFTNTFHTFEFETGGKWIYTMHGPDGKDYPNESVFREIEPDSKVVIEHIVLPKYLLTITFSESDSKTLVTWEQVFENQTFATKMRDFLETANRQNLERLTIEVKRGIGLMTDRLESINAAYSALNNGDIEGFVRDFHADIVRIEFFDDSPNSGVHHGINAVKTHVFEGRSTWAEGACEIERLTTAGDKIVVDVHVHVRLHNQTNWINGRVTDVFTFRDGKIVDFRSFTDETQALEWASDKNFS